MMRDNHLIEPIKSVLEAASQTISEYELIQCLQSQGWLESMDSRDSLSLYSVHFLVYNALYQISEDCRCSQNSRHLHISALAIGWVACRQAPSNGQDVKILAEDNHAEMEKLAAYYLDWANLDAATTDSVDALLNGFWQQYVADEDYTQALAALNMSASNSFAEIKKSYRRLAMVHHPDKGGDESRFHKIQWAFSLVQRRMHG